MNVVITARRTKLSKKFEELADAKLGKVRKMAPDALSVHVVVTHQANPSMSQDAQNVEITVYAGKDCIRASASDVQDVSAFDKALDKLMQRLKKFRGRHNNARRQEREGAATSNSVQGGASFEPSNEEKMEVSVKSEDGGEELIEAHLGDAVFEVRRKIHEAEPMGVDEAIYRMELLGHDFFIFMDEGTGLPAALYRRHGKDYGILELKNKQ